MFEVQLNMLYKSNLIWASIVDTYNNKLHTFDNILDAERAIIKLQNEFAETNFRIIEVSE